MISIVKNTLFSLFIIALGFFHNARGADIDRSLDNAVRSWDKFVTALSRGDMPEAYNLLSNESKKVLSYRDFCVEWHPIGIKYNTVLSNPGYSNFSIHGNIATVKLGLDTKLNNSSHYFIRILLEKDSGQWYIVTESCQADAICKASITSVLKDIIRESKQLNSAFTTGKGDIEQIIRELPRIFTSDRGQLALNNYHFELDLLRDGVLKAVPNRKGIQGYQISADGIISEFIPAKNEVITAEKLQIRREKELQTKRLTGQNNFNSRQHTVDRKVNAESIQASAQAPAAQVSKPRTDLPDLPPEFPVDFDRGAEIAAGRQTDKRLNFIKSKEDFDLPEIDSINRMLANKKNAQTSENKLPANRPTQQPQTMAGAADEVHSNNVDLSSEALLEELELMVDEYTKDTTITVSGVGDE